MSARLSGNAEGSRPQTEPLVKTGAGDRVRTGDPQEAAQRLGVSTAIVYKLCATGQLAHIRVLNALRIAPAALAAVMTAPPSWKA